MSIANKTRDEVRELLDRIRSLEGELDTARAAERSLRARESEMRAVLDSTADGIVSVGEDGKIITFNPAAERIFGYRCGEVIGREILHLFPAAQHAVHAGIIATCRAAHDPIVACRNQEVLGLKKSGCIFPFELSVYRVHTEDRVLFTGIMHDLTERRQAEDALVHLSEAVRESIGQELHDVLGQELTGISLLAKSLENALRERGGDELQDAREIGNLAKTALGEARRLAHGLYPAELERHGLGPALAELAFTQEKLYKVRCRLSGRVDPRLITKFKALHLYRIAQEAVNNAVKHAHTEEIALSLQIRDQDLVMGIRDRGAGIKEGAAMSHGMGMTIMQYRARIIGAHLDIREAEHGGTAVTCILPVADLGTQGSDPGRSS